MSAPASSGDELDRWALGVVMAAFAGPEVPPWLAALTRRGLAAVCLFGSNLRPPGAGAPGRAAPDGGAPGGGAPGPGPGAPDPGADSTARRLADELHALRPDLLVALDEEGGDVTRLDAGTGSRLPGAAALGAADDVDLSRAVAADLGQRLRAAGVDLDLAPVLDVNSSPENPVIGVRSFGSDPELVARHGAAAITGLQSAGVAACAKHFPGHGDTVEDSHVAAPRVLADPATLERRELVPFAAAVDAGVAAVMTAHVVVPALDPDQPASTSTAAHGLLRGRLGFDGVVVSDALDMAAVSGPAGHGSLGAAAVAALAAGADLLCLGPDGGDGHGSVQVVTRELVAAVRAGRLPPARLADAATRVAALGRSQRTRREAAVEAARRALRLTGPVPPLAGAVVARLGDVPTIAAGDVPWGIAGELATRVPGVRPLDVAAPPEGPDSPERGDDPAAGPAAAGPAAAGPALSARRVLSTAAGLPLVLAVRDLDRRPRARTLVGQVLADRPDAVVVDLGWPSTGLPSGVTVLRTHGSSRASAAAAADLLAARQATEPTGREPTGRAPTPPTEDT